MDIKEAVKGIAQSELPALRSAVSEMAASPKDIPAKLMELLRGLWTKLQEAGIIDFVIAKAKELFAALSGAANTASSAAGETLPLVQNANDQVAAAAAKASSSLKEVSSSAADAVSAAIAPPTTV
jgi:hypothetical protein